VEIGILEEEESSEWDLLFQSLATPKKNGTIRFVAEFKKLNLLLKRRMSPFSYYKYWRHHPFDGRVYLCFSIERKYGLLSHQT
jgi:hypothetical protein